LSFEQFMVKKLKPQVKRKWLIMISGTMWTGVGVLLIWIASRWFPAFNTWQSALALTSGPLLGLAIAYFGFSNLASRNADRILGYPEKVCVFAFQRWQMYILIVVMISMGIVMRTTSFIPRFLLAPVYIGIGSALFLSSFIYYKKFFKTTPSTSVFILISLPFFTYRCLAYISCFSDSI